MKAFRLVGLPETEIRLCFRRTQFELEVGLAAERKMNIKFLLNILRAFLFCKLYDAEFCRYVKLTVLLFFKLISLQIGFLSIIRINHKLIKSKIYFVLLEFFCIIEFFIRLHSKQQEGHREKYMVAFFSILTYFFRVKRPSKNRSHFDVCSSGNECSQSMECHLEINYIFSISISVSENRKSFNHCAHLQFFQWTCKLKYDKKKNLEVSRSDTTRLLRKFNLWSYLFSRDSLTFRISD